MNEKRNICLHINDQRCWRCGVRPESYHHAIPKCMKPKDNVLIPLCNKCHKELHSVGVNKRESYDEKMDRWGKKATP
jgi:hypothetical protein